jgi:hypothetical protein
MLTAALLAQTASQKAAGTIIMIIVGGAIILAILFHVGGNLARLAKPEVLRTFLALSAAVFLVVTLIAAVFVPSLGTAAEFGGIGVGIVFLFFLLGSP